MRYRYVMIVLALAGLAARLCLAVWTPTGFDLQSYELVVGILRQGGNVYAATARYNYTPIWFWILAACAELGALLHIGMPVVVRMLLTIVDACDALLIAVIAARLQLPRWSGLVYWLNPVAIGVSAVQGQFEALALLPLLGMVWLLLRPQRPALLLLWLLAALALAIKHLIIFQVWLVLIYALGVRRASLIAAAAVGAGALLFMPYLGAGGAEGILQHVLLYRSVGGLYGLGALLPGQLATAIFATVGIIAPIVYYRRRLPLADALVQFSVLWTVLMPGLGQQYWLVPIVFASWRLSRSALHFTVAATLFIVTLMAPLVPVVWLIAVAWLVALHWPSPDRQRPVPQFQVRSRKSD